MKGLTVANARKAMTNRLPINFHKSFIPERHYIHAMMRFSAGGQTGDYPQISTVTGIPMGASSGKVPAILDYCKAMGLICLMGKSRSSVKKPDLTPFGRVVFREDPHLKERITQWIAHFNLCSVIGGADAWYQVFFEGVQTLGSKFTKNRLQEHLAFVYGNQKGNLAGPLVRMYQDEASFQACSALIEADGYVCRQPAPHCRRVWLRLWRMVASTHS